MASLVKCRIKLAYSHYVHIQKNTNIEGFLSCFLGTACFFVRALFKHLCLKDTGIIQSSGSWGNLSFLELSENTCFDPEAQFRFRDNGAMLNLKRQGCVAAFNRKCYKIANTCYLAYKLADTYSEYLTHSDNCISIKSWPPLKYMTLPEILE